MAKLTAAALLDGLPRSRSCVFRDFTTFDASNEADKSPDWVRSYPIFLNDCLYVVYRSLKEDTNH